MQQIVDIIKTGKFDYILIEASGVCEPLPIAQTITVLSDQTEQYGLPKICYLDNIVTVVDSLRLRDEFNCGDNLVKEDIDDEDIENLLIQQIEFCTKIILNKVDELKGDELNQIKAIIRKLQPKAEIIETNYGKVDIDKILNTKSFDFEEASQSAGWLEELNREDNEEEEEGETEEYGIGTFVYFRKSPFNKEKFDKYVSGKFPGNVIRCKGLFWFADEPEMGYVFEQSGKQIQAYEVGEWMSEDDKIIKLVFIGRDMDKEEIIKELDNCLEK